MVEAGEQRGGDAYGGDLHEAAPVFVCVRVGADSRARAAFVFIRIAAVVFRLARIAPAPPYSLQPVHATRERVEPVCGAGQPRELDEQAARTLHENFAADELVEIGGLRASEKIAVAAVL